MSAAALSVAGRIPGFVRNLNAMAETAGMHVRLEVGPYSSDPEVRLWSVWEGTKAQLHSLKLFTPRQEVLLFMRSSVAGLTVPGQARVWYPETAILCGDMRIDGDAISWRIDSGAWPCAIERRGDVEIVTYAEAVTYWGPLEALIAIGIDRRRLPGPKRNGLGNWSGEGRGWLSRRQLDGTVRYHLESEACMHRRASERERRDREELERHEQTMEMLGWNVSQPPKKAEAPGPRRAFLRLVVNNTREDAQ